MRHVFVDTLNEYTCIVFSLTKTQNKTTRLQKKQTTKNRHTDKYTSFQHTVKWVI